MAVFRVMNQSVTDVIAREELPLDGGHFSNASCKTRLFVSRVRMTDVYPPNCKNNPEIVYGSVLPAVTVIITVANLVIISVFMKPRIRSHTTIILTAIAVADTLGLVTPTIAYVYYYTLGHYSEPVPYRFCWWTYILCNTLKNLFNLISIWLTVILAVIRYRCIKSPFKASSIHSRRNVLISIIIIVMTAMLIQSSSLFSFEFSPIDYIDPVTNQTYEACTVSSSNVLHEYNPCLYRQLQLWTEIVVSSFVPCTMLVVLDITMLLALKKASTIRYALQRDDNQKLHGLKFQNGRQRSDTKSAQMTSKTEFEMQHLASNQSDSDSEKCQAESKSGGNNVMCKPVDNYTACINYDVTKANVTNTDIPPPSDFMIYSKEHAKRHSSLLSRVRKKLKRSPRSSTSTHNEQVLEKLDRESRRTSLLLIIVVAIIVTNKIPLAVLVARMLATRRGSLPLNLFGCSNVFYHLWGHMMYPLIFIIYCSMSSAFRQELLRMITCNMTKFKTIPGTNPVKRPNDISMSPCCDRRALNSNKDCRIAEPDALHKNGPRSN